MSDAQAMLKAAGYEAPEEEKKVSEPEGPTGGFVVEYNGKLVGTFPSADSAAAWLKYNGYDGTIRRLREHP